MKKIKYTNTGVKLLAIQKYGRVAIIFDHEFPSYCIKLTTIRNHSKYEKAKTKIEYGKYSYIVESNKDNVIVFITNCFLFYSLAILKKYDLMVKLIDINISTYDRDLLEYVAKMAGRRYLNEKTI